MAAVSVILALITLCAESSISAQQTPSALSAGSTPDEAQENFASQVGIGAMSYLTNPTLWIDR
jgi:hypothetical protein